MSSSKFYDLRHNDSWGYRVSYCVGEKIAIAYSDSTESDFEKPIELPRTLLPTIVDAIVQCTDMVGLSVGNMQLSCTQIIEYGSYRVIVGPSNEDCREASLSVEKNGENAGAIELGLDLDKVFVTLFRHIIDEEKL